LGESSLFVLSSRLPLFRASLAATREDGAVAAGLCADGPLSKSALPQHAARRRPSSPSRAAASAAPEDDGPRPGRREVSHGSGVWKEQQQQA